MVSKELYNQKLKLKHEHVKKKKDKHLKYQLNKTISAVYKYVHMLLSCSIFTILYSLATIGVLVHTNAFKLPTSLIFFDTFPINYLWYQLSNNNNG